MTAPKDLLEEAIQLAREGRHMEARDLLMQLVEQEPHNEVAWIWLTGLVDELEDKIIACENVLTINPDNERVRAYLNQLLEKKKQQGAMDIAGKPAAHVPAVLPQDRPRQEAERRNLSLVDLARQYEAEGDLDQALKTYGEQASRAKDSREFDRIFREISRIEGIRAEQISHVSPATTITRLSLSWPMLYLALVLVQAGLNPAAQGSWYLWLGLPIVAAGSFLLAVAEVRSRNALWRRIFGEESEAGSSMARTSAAIGGWILVLMPHAFLLAAAITRLEGFQPPPSPF